ncbi:MAG: SWIM zinc finger family protein [Halochromatium sp.]|uniref:SWIM zinc finger family protein n=1 Tax=Halochromatium sp. TaxID=2049430 RepID=UPI00397BF933
MSSHGKTWWGQHFLAALEEQMDAGRLQRGRSYAGPSRILRFEISAKGLVSATVRGNVNPYFGVTKEPRYEVAFQLKPIPAKARKTLIAELGSRADLVSRLLMNEMPDGIDAAFAASGFTLLPRSEKDFQRADCSCPDWANPCKHIAGVYYRLADRLDQDPLLLFELRGLARTQLRTELARTPLGQALAPLMNADEQAPPEPVASLYPPLLARTGPSANTEAVAARAFWQAPVPLPEDEAQPADAASVPAMLIKKGGDFPPFWDRSQSFIAVMEAFYQRVKTKNKQRL